MVRDPYLRTTLRAIPQIAQAHQLFSGGNTYPEGLTIPAPFRVQCLERVVVLGSYPPILWKVKRKGGRRNRKHRPLSDSTEITDQDYVAALIASGEQQLLAVAGPGEIKNTAGGKVCDLPRGSAGE